MKRCLDAPTGRYTIIGTLASLSKTRSIATFFEDSFMPAYFLYCRKSSEAEDRQILSIDSKVTELKRHAARKGLHIKAVLTEAKSAKAPGRPVFNSMMELLYRGEADGVLCWKLDRLARNPVDGGSIIWAMKEHAVKIITPFQTYGQSEDNVVWMYLESAWPKSTSTT